MQGVLKEAPGALTQLLKCEQRASKVVPASWLTPTGNAKLRECKRHLETPAPDAKGQGSQRFMVSEPGVQNAITASFIMTRDAKSWLKVSKTGDVLSFCRVRELLDF